MTSLLDWLLPPQIKLFLRGALSGFFGFRKVESWEVARAKSSGYESSDVIDPIVLNTSVMRNQLSKSVTTNSRYQQVAGAMLYCLTELDLENTRTYRVLDFGGGGGDYFFYFQKFAPNLKLDWTVLETPALTQAFENQSSNQIRWKSSLDEIEPIYEVILLSSVLQYLEYPYEILNMLAGKTKFLIINRLPLIPGSRDLTTLQRIRTIKKKSSYPARFFGSEGLIQKLEDLGRIEMQWQVIEDQPVLGRKAFPNQGLILRTNSCVADRSLD